MEHKFIQLQPLEKECRCCGRGREHICGRCEGLLHNGYCVLLELKEQSTMEHKKFTGRAVAVITEGLYEHPENGDPSIPLTSNSIYFIRSADLKDFMKDEYSIDLRPVRNTAFLNGPPRSAKRHAAKGTRPVSELSTG